MGMTAKVELNPAIAVEVHAAKLRGLTKGGELILAASDVLCPIEPGEPKHGVHGVETGFVRPEAGGPEGDRVKIGYEAFWLLWQHERMDYHHTHGEAKFLEIALLERGEAALAVAAEAIRQALA